MHPGRPFHAELIDDGNTSGGESLTLYASGTVTEITLANGEWLHITDIQISTETGGVVYLCADGKVDGEYIFAATLDAKDFISHHFSQPRACAAGTGLKFFGISTNLDTCFVEGYITKG